MNNIPEATQEARAENRRRVRTARACADRYVALTEGKGFDAEDYGMMDAIVDLTADLLHLAEAHGLETDRVLDRARDHFWAEVDEARG